MNFINILYSYIIQIVKIKFCNTRIKSKVIYNDNPDEKLSIYYLVKIPQTSKSDIY